jgi:Uma2 family endonuclease
MMLLIQSLEYAWRERDDFFVAGNMFVYFSELQAKASDFRGPDVFVVMDTVRRERKSWVVWEEEGRTPDVVIELLSPSTEQVDRGDKMRIYAKLMHVAEYYLFDPWDGRFEAYELDRGARSYRRREPDAQGRFFSPSTGFTLGVVPARLGEIDAPWLRWIDANGKVLPEPTEHALELAAAAREERSRAAQERARAEQGEARAEQGEARAEQEKARADEAERRIAELERQLRER